MENNLPQTNVHPVIASSVDATKVSATVTGILTGLSGVIMLIATVYHYPLQQNQLNNFIQEFAAATSAVVTAGGMAFTAYGLLRKLTLRVFPSKNTVTPVVVAPTEPVI